MSESENINDLDNIMRAVMSCINDDNKIGSIALMRILRQEIDNLFLRSRPPLARVDDEALYTRPIKSCSECDSTSVIDYSVAYTSMPPKYKGICITCGHEDYFTS